MLNLPFNNTLWAGPYRGSSTYGQLGKEEAEGEKEQDKERIDTYIK